MEEIRQRIVRRFTKAVRPAGGLLYLSLYETIKILILENEIPAGVLLPSTRNLASTLQISRSTVNRVYELLQMESFIEARHGYGFMVHDQRPQISANREQRRTISYPELSLAGRSFLENTGHINPTDDKEIAFRPGLPPLDIFPVKQWQRLHNFYWKHITFSDLSYYPTSGIEPLRKSLATYLNVSRGIKCEHDQIIVVSGSLQSLFLAGKTLIEPGDGVVMENPTFPNVYTLFKSLNARVQSLELDEQGMDIRHYQKKAKERLKLIHVTPSAHYPSGRKMSLLRRQELLSFAVREKAMIIENDYEHELTRTGEDIPTLFSMDQGDRVIYLGTFNRLLHPAIRIGFMVVPYYLLEAVQALQKMSHRFISPTVQFVMNQFIERKYLNRHLAQLQEIARERKVRFSNMFEEAFEGKLTLNPSETEVLHLVVPFPQDVNENRLIRMFHENNIVVHSLSKCYEGDAPVQGMIIAYSCVPYPLMRKKILEMARLFKDQKKTKW